MPLPNIENRAPSYVRCPNCCSGDLSVDDKTLFCADCDCNFHIEPEIGFYGLLDQDPSDGNTRNTNIQKWWGDLYRQLYEETDSNLTTDILTEMVDGFEDLMEQRRHLVTEEMPLKDLAGKLVLEIGPGGGGHSCLFQKYGARVVAADITPERALSTAKKLALMPGGPGAAYNANAENLPFQDNSFDVVYTNGVLHHAQDTDRCFEEVLRVLKPGGQVIAMLYSRHSATFWLNILPRAIFTGRFFRLPEPEWIGQVTEGTPKFGETRNPYTRVYSKSQIYQLMTKFEVTQLRKSSFQFDNFCIPRLTQMRNWLLRKIGRAPHPGGTLVYGAPYMTETNLELLLGRYLGFSWNIVATKPTKDDENA